MATIVRLNIIVFNLAEVEVINHTTQQQFTIRTQDSEPGDTPTLYTFAHTIAAISCIIESCCIIQKKNAPNRDRSI